MATGPSDSLDGNHDGAHEPAPDTMDGLARSDSMDPNALTASNSAWLDLPEEENNQVERCECGNIFMPDAVFCRKCGRPRPVEANHTEWSARPLWKWSGHFGQLRGRRKFCGCGHDEADKKPFRFLDRDGPFRQSVGKWNILRTASQGSRDIQHLYMMDAFHTFIDGERFWVQLLIYASVYTLCFLVFGFFYLAISDGCGLGLDGSYTRAYYLSVETMTTIGYGVPDPYYNDCWEGTVVLTLQALLSTFLGAFVIGSVFVRLTRPQARSNTILFSEKAVIQVIDGAFYFVFQVCEAKHHDLLEAHVRCYAIRRDRKADRLYQSFPLRLQHPDDDRGAALMLTLPTRVVHRIDNWSPLAPSWNEIRRLRYIRTRRSMRKAGAGSSVPQAFRTDPTEVEPGFWACSPEVDVPQRQVDAEQGSRDTCACPTCGESFQTMELLQRHTAYQAAQDSLVEVPPELRHSAFTQAECQAWGWSLVAKPTVDAQLSFDGRGSANTDDVQVASSTKTSTRTPEPSVSNMLGSTSIQLTPTKSGTSRRPVLLEAGTTPDISRQDLEDFMADRWIEVVVLVEGVEPTTSSTLQARHSYLLPDDIEFDKDFADCLMLGSEERPCAIDLGKFHDLVSMEPTYGNPKASVKINDVNSHPFIAI